MPVQPKPYKLVCSKCGEQMERKELDKLDTLFSIFK